MVSINEEIVETTNNSIIKTNDDSDSGRSDSEEKSFYEKVRTAEESNYNNEKNY